ncbi:ABC transporter permease [Raoultibacter timonensis]|uniref:Multidrug ABC transporter permease n=1 Tax=Raoultibacter timonensis TaxID=1907662 RepID=A0ABM7WM61_9ACTN|nr:ABC transporter permease [Raoultibacter timonensis]BDE97496.1 multidrug ABC transporter permease [Raoultibacter timonensis]BDF52099.1 multidrug ABC transporter permease [Raoultibacter timonensis]
MFNVFKGALMVLTRKRELFIWSLAFPILLSTMFMLMFANLDDATAFDPVATAVVADAHYDEATAFSSVIDELGEEGDDQLLDIRTFATVDEARNALTAGEVIGIVSVEADGTPKLAVSPDSGGLGVEQIGRTILDTVMNTYVRNADLLASLAADNPLALADPDLVEEALTHGNATVQVSLTHSTPVQSVRYYYALLGMAALFCGQVGMLAICETQPNLTPLGARRAIGATSRGKTLVATLAASWAISFACLLVAFLFIRFVVGVDFAGREGMCVVAIAVAALFATSLGTLLGSLPKVGFGVKTGLLTGLTCLLSLFAGLYGEPCMDLADQIAREAPVLAAVNPAKVVTDAFYSLYYYDSLVPFAEKAGILLIMTVVLFAVSALFVRRQRYASL